MNEDQWVFINSDGHFYQFDYDKNGNPKVRSRIIGKPRLAHDMEAALEYAEESRTNPNFDTQKMAGWLWMRNAVAHQKTVEALRRQLVSDREKRNSELGKEIAALKGELKPLKEREAELAPNFEALRIKTGGEIKDSRVYFAKDVGRYSVEAMAGANDIHRGRPNKPWYSERFGWVTALGSGTILGASLGFLTGKLNLDQFDPVAAGIFIGAGSLTFASACKGIRPVNFKLGQFSFSMHTKGKLGRWVVPLVTAGIVVGSAVLLGIADMNVEQFGIFKALSETATQAGMKLSPSQMVWVSMVVVLPILLYTMLTAQADGYEFAASDALTSLQEAKITEVSASEDGQSFAKVATLIDPIRKDIAKIEAKIADCEKSIRHDFSQKEERQLGEVTDDGIDYTIQAQGANNLPSYSEGGRNTTAKPNDTSPWWRKILPGT